MGIHNHCQSKFGVLTQLFISINITAKIASKPEKNNTTTSPYKGFLIALYKTYNALITTKRNRAKPTKPVW